MEPEPEPEPERPRIDLRLVPAASGLWMGSCVALLDQRIAWWTAGLVIVVVPIGFLWKVRWWHGWMLLLGCLVAGIVITGLRVIQQADDPLTAAADRGAWASTRVTVTGYPQAAGSGFASPDGPGRQNGSGDGLRWRVPAAVQEATVAARTWPSQLTIVVYGQGSGWAEVTPGEQLSVAGRVAVQDRGALLKVVLRARDPPTVVASAPWWDATAATLRQTLKATAAPLGGDRAGLLPGLVVGDTSGIDDRLSTDAKTTGITHLLAVSGSHFAMLCGAVVVVLRRRGPRFAAVGGTVTLLGLVVLVGPEASVLRAAVMGGIGLLGLFGGRSRSAMPALATAVLVLLLTDSELALSAGFALSVLASAGLILIAPAWSAALQARGWPAGWADLLVVPVVAQLVTMPVIVLISGTVSVVGVVANLLVAPVVAPALLLGVLCAIAGPWWNAAAVILARMTGPLLDWVAWVAHSLARWPDAAVSWPETPAGAITLAVLTVLVVMFLRRRRGRAMAIAAVLGIAAVLLPARVVATGWPVAGWLLTACEVGQGDAMVLSTGEDHTAVMVDAGPDPDLADACLRRLSVATIPLLVITHLHADHVDGLVGVLRGRSVGAVAVGPDRDPGSGWSTVLEAAAASGVPVVSLTPGVRWSSGGLRLTALAPNRLFHGTDSDPNNDSVVLLAEHDGERILMTGDIETEAQQALLGAGVDLNADVLKVPHHGSAKLLDSFVRAVSPTVAVIGVGLGNDYGHPSPRTLDLLQRDGVGEVLRTDLQGDVSVGSSDGALTTAFRGATSAGR